MAEQAGASRITRRKSEFRDRITRAALRLFAEQGVAETSIAAIIKEADIAHKTFFNHFPTKDHLLQHIVSSYSELAYARFRVSFDHCREPRQQLEHCLMAIARSLSALNAERFRGLLTFYFVSNASSREFREQQKQQFAALVLQILQRAREQQQLRSTFSNEVLADMVVGLCVATLLNWCVEENYPVEPKMKQAVDFITASIFVEESP